MGFCSWYSFKRPNICLYLFLLSPFTPSFNFVCPTWSLLPWIQGWPDSLFNAQDDWHSVLTLHPSFEHQEAPTAHILLITVQNIKIWKNFSWFHSLPFNLCGSSLRKGQAWDPMAPCTPGDSLASTSVFQVKEGLSYWKWQVCLLR